MSTPEATLEPLATPAADPVAKQGDLHARALLLVGAATALGYALQLSNGNLHPQSILFLTVGFALTLIATAAPTWQRADRWRDLPLLALLSVAVTVQLALLITAMPGIYLQPQGSGMAPFHAGLVISAVLIGAGLTQAPSAKRLWLPLLLATHFLLGVWLIHSSPHPFIDVFVFQRDAVATLLSGQNPYAMTYPDIYGNSPFYGPGLSVNGRLTFGFPYPPLSLLLAIPGQVLAGDYRCSQLVAMTLSGGLMAYCRPGRIAPLAAALYLFTPRTFFVLEQGWTEPYAVLLLSAVVFAACRRPRLVPYLFGLLLAVKQYFVLLVPLAWLLLPRPLPPRRELARMLGKVVAVGAAVSLPLALWNFQAFWRDVVALQVFQPFRVEALSYLAWWARDGSVPLPTSLAFVAALVGVAIALWRAPRTPAGFACAVALTYFGFFAFNKQAFCNYYYFVVGAVCCAAAAMRPATEASQR